MRYFDVELDCKAHGRDCVVLAAEVVDAPAGAESDLFTWREEHQMITPEQSAVLRNLFPS